MNLKALEGGIEIREDMGHVLSPFSAEDAPNSPIVPGQFRLAKVDLGFIQKLMDAVGDGGAVPLRRTGFERQMLDPRRKGRARDEVGRARDDSVRTHITLLEGGPSHRT